MAQRVARVWLGGLIVLFSLLGPVVGLNWMPAGALVLPLLAAGMLVPRRTVLVLNVLAAGALAIEIARTGWDGVRAGTLVVLAITAAFAYRLASNRERLGVQGMRGEAMLVDLRDRLRAQGEMPALPDGWQTEALIRSAGPTSFGGDFMVAALTEKEANLEIALVDVSGKGLDAATRALLLSGALGGLLGAVPPEHFLPAANDYLLRQRWPEGFATAVHLVVNLESGHYVVESAGHPPPVQFVSGSGRWRLIDDEGTALGIMPEARYASTSGVLARGDAMLLYTDGLVETSEREISVGIDKLVGEAERLIPRGFRDGARLLLETVAPHGSDDRALIVLWRD
jgi:hypothetical protein